MNYDQTKQEMMILSPKLFPTEDGLLRHLFFVNGNGMEWINGQLVDVYETRPFDELLAETREQERLHREQYERECAELNEAIQADGFEPGPQRTYEEVYCKPRNISSMYPLCRYARIVNIPRDIQPDWLEAARKALVVAESLERTPEDDQWLDYARRLIDEIGAAREY